MKQMTFIQAMKDYFGLLPDQTPVGFMKEIKALSPDERSWFRSTLPSVGYQIVDAPVAAA
jgi:hypothetical protein